jgi:hypothetical protein
MKLTTTDRNKLEYDAKLIVTTKGAANHVKLYQLDANQGPVVPVVNEFSDALPEELPGMPLDRDIDFVIELVSEIALIYKRPYRMVAKQLAEVKD